MIEVVCWCCKYFLAKYEDPIFSKLITKGMCTYKLQTRESEECVCEEFLLYSGLMQKE